MNPDTRDLLALLARAPAGEHTLATVVRTAGSSYRRPGARLLVHARGPVIGSVSGGCLEAELVRRGAWWAAHGPTLRRFAATLDAGDDEGASPGCGGTVDVLVERVGPDAPALAALRWIAAQRQAACLATVIAGPATGARAAFTAGATWGEALPCRSEARTVLATGRPAWIARAGGELFLEPVAAPRELLIAGRHHDVAPVVRLARAVGWEVTSASRGVAPRALGEPDHRIDPDEDAVAAWARARPDAALLLMTHSLDLDRRLLGALLATGPRAYLGVLGPRHRTAALVEALALAPGALAGLRSPVGLDLGGDGPEAIALSIVADLQATWSGRSGARLCPPSAATWAARPRLVGGA